MFEQPIVDWWPPQRDIMAWLRYYDNFYEACRMQHYITEEKEVGKSWMAEYDVLVDAFMTWYEWADKQKRSESPQASSAGHEAKVPSATEHKELFIPAHR